jgi:molecular chaperone GrpE
MSKRDKKDSEKVEPGQGQDAPKAGKGAAEAGAEESTGDEKEPQADEAAGQPEPASEEGDTLESVQGRLAASEDKYIRLLAEFDNYKRRTRREMERFAGSANEALMQHMIDVRENFERALQAGSTKGDSQALYEGMKLIYTKFDEVLGSQGLEPFGDSGDEFDPALHDALMKTPHEEVPEDHIAEVLERGYRLNGRVIRHARVIVSAGSAPQEPGPQAEAAQGTEDGEEQTSEK